MIVRKQAKKGSPPFDWWYWIIIAWLCFSLVMNIHDWIWPPPSKTVQHGEWAVETTEHGYLLQTHILSIATSGCHDEGCITFKYIDIACFLGSEDHNFSIFASFPKQYSVGFEQIKNGMASAVLVRPEGEKKLGEVKTKAFQDPDGTLAVEFNDTKPMIEALLSTAQGKQNVLKIEGSFTIQLDIPLDGFNDGFNDLVSRCGKGWQIP